MIVQAYMNTDEDNFDGYREGHALASAPDLIFRVASSTAWDSAWEIGNRMAADLDGDRWPEDVRSLSVGDVIGIGHQSKRLWLSVEKAGFRLIDEPTNFVKLAGQKRVTSR